MPYTYANLSDTLTALGNRLYDPDHVFWSADELIVYIHEALRTWNALTGFWRAEFAHATTASKTWYDIADATDVPETLRPFTITDDALYVSMEYSLLEPPTGATWTGSLQFNAAEMTQALMNRRDEILSATGCTISIQTPAAIVGRIYLDDKTIDVRRVAWLPVTVPGGYVNTPLWPDDTFALAAYQRDYTVAPQGQPTTYQQSTEPPLSFDVDVQPAVPGTYEVLSVNAGETLPAPIPPALLRIPDDFTWVAKWGVLADLLNRDSNARDPMRAKYCEMRYQHGLALLLNAPAVLETRVANLPLDDDSVQNQDNFNTFWQAQGGQPDTSLSAGLNLVGLSPVPDGVYSITFTVVQNAPVPLQLSDKIQLGRDDYETMLDYAQHIASFKMGGAEFTATIPLLQRFLKQAALYNSKLLALGEYMKAIYELSSQQAAANPVYATVTPATADTQGGS